MKYFLLGKSGLRVSEICLGTMTFGKEWGWGASKEESRKIFDAYVDAGGNFIDTANIYTDGTSEKYVSDFVSYDRDRFVIATKYTSNTRAGDPNAGGNHRKNMVQSLEASLKRLNTDYIDLYWVHAWDQTTPIEEMMRALDDMVKSGKILYIGISDAPAWVVSQANTLANLKGWTEFASIQIEYSLIERTSERELLPMANVLDIGITAWSPLGSGVLTGKYNKSSNKEYKNNTVNKDYKQTESTTNDTNTSTSSSSLSASDQQNSSRLNVANFSELSNTLLKERNLRIAEEVVNIAGEIKRTPSQVALNWIRHSKKILRNKIIPIIGAKNLVQINDNLACMEFVLSDEYIQRLNEVSKIELGFPHNFLSTDAIRNIIYGGTYLSIYDHRRSS
ncbi:MAG TPA: aldo/keto reductase [Candidatus Nitrosocosmicus sp.]|nr:aldo/keto reductase [Candidatus Nitrosocosmicus sp.]